MLNMDQRISTRNTFEIGERTLRKDPIVSM